MMGGHYPEASKPAKKPSPIIAAFDSLRDAFIAMMLWQHVVEGFGGPDVGEVLQEDIEQAFLDVQNALEPHQWELAEHTRYQCFQAAKRWMARLDSWASEGAAP